MEEIKKIFRGSFLTSGMILIYGMITRNEIVYIGFFLGSLMSMLNLYLMLVDMKRIVISQNGKKVAILGYLKRYFLYGLLLLIMVKLGRLPMLLGGAVGLLNVRANIYRLTLISNLKKWKVKNLEK